jgi:hypothetical protein
MNHKIHHFVIKPNNSKHTQAIINQECWHEIYYVNKEIFLDAIIPTLKHRIPSELQS